MSFFTIAAAVFLVLLVAGAAHNKTSLLTGFLLLCFIFSAGCAYVFWAAGSGNEILQLSVVAVIFLAAGVLLFGVYILIALLLLNARIVLKRERRSLGNSLTLLLALALIALCVMGWWALEESSLLLRMAWGGAMGVAGVYFVVLCTFLASAALCRVPPLRKNAAYIIVLGSGLVNGEVPPLLGARIRRAVRFYERQKKRRTPPKLIFSGGQGPDEPCPEAEAMARYAATLGVPEQDILREGKSRNTRENLAFSHVIVREREAGGTPVCVVATSSYHLLRALRLARAEGLATRGVGSRVALYYLPSALLREFIALMWQYKRRHAVLAVVSFAFGCFGMAVLGLF